MKEGQEVSPLIAAAHELKAPLALVRQLALHLEDVTSRGASPAEQTRLIQQIQLTSERALRLTSDLTRASRMDDGLFTLEPMNPEQICHDIATELTPLFTAHGRSLVVDHHHRQLLLVANRDLLRRVLMNFSDNALHYSQPGTAVRIRIQSLTKKGTIRLSIRDVGPALPHGLWKNLHQRLLRSPHPMHARPQSSGLGLYIASQFAGAMQGTIGAIRHKDGATFYIDLQASGQLQLL